MPDLDLVPSEQKPTSAWEQAPWRATERVVEELARPAEPPLQLTDEGVVDAPLDGDSIVKA
jgi:hypothetical protein